MGRSADKKLRLLVNLDVLEATLTKLLINHNLWVFVFSQQMMMIAQAVELRDSDLVFQFFCNIFNWSTRSDSLNLAFEDRMLNHLKVPSNLEDFCSLLSAQLQYFVESFLHYLAFIDWALCDFFSLQEVI